MFGPGVESACDLNTDVTTMEVDISNGAITDFIQECDDYVLGLTKDNKATWFPSQELTDKWLDDAFMNSTKQHKKAQKSTFKIKTTKTLEVYNSSKEVVSHEEVRNGTKMSLIVHLCGIWFTKSRFGITWKVRQIKLNEAKSMKTGICMFEDEDAEVDPENFPDE